MIFTVETITISSTPTASIRSDRDKNDEPGSRSAGCDAPSRTERPKPHTDPQSRPGGCDASRRPRAWNARRLAREHRPFPPPPPRRGRPRLGKTRGAHPPGPPTPPLRSRGRGARRTRPRQLSPARPDPRQLPRRLRARPQRSGGGSWTGVGRAPRPQAATVYVDLEGEDDRPGRPAARGARL